MKKQKGFALVEIMIASGIVTLALLAAVGVASKSLQASRQAVRLSQASFLLEEGAEALKSMRDMGWTTITNYSTNTEYYLVCTVCSGSSAEWSLSATPSQIDGIFTRTIVFSPVYRDENDDITTSGATPDTGTRKVTITLSWENDGESSSRTLIFYLSNVFI